MLVFVPEFKFEKVKLSACTNFAVACIYSV